LFLDWLVYPYGYVCTSSPSRLERAIMTKAGFDAVNLTRGMTAWQAAGLPMVSCRGEKGAVR
jgi:rhodanese-related sulfurtransferase